MRNAREGLFLCPGMGWVQVSSGAGTISRWTLKAEDTFARQKKGKVIAEK